MTDTSLDAIFCPRSVAVVGATPREHALGNTILRNLVLEGFAGPVFPVNPRHPVVHSTKCYPSVASIGEPVDLAIIVVPAVAVYGVIEECLDAGVRGFVLISAGFKEIGGEGLARERELEKLLESRGARAVGPNCMGVINLDPAVRLHATFAPTRPRPGRVGFISQSGALGATLLFHARELGLGVRQFASIGNKVDITSNDLLEYWADDDNIGLVLMYLENFGAPRRFSSVARRITAKKPVIAVKSGRSSAGARAVASHTGALGSLDATTDALFEQCGIVRVDSIAQLFDLAVTFESQPLPRGNRVGILTDAGGPGVLATDACEALGLTVPELAPETMRALKPHLPPSAGAGNPIDLTAEGGAKHYAVALKALLADDNIDAVITIYVPPVIEDAPTIAAAIRDTVDEYGAGKPVLACIMAEESVLATMKGGERTSASNGRGRVPVYRYPEPCARGLAAMLRYRRFLDRPAVAPMRFADVNASAAKAVLEEASRRKETRLDQAQMRALLEAYGFPLAVEATAASVTEAGDVAARVAGETGCSRLAIKYLSPHASHKSDLGLVRLDIAPEDAVRVAGEIAEAARGHVPADEPPSFLVQEMVPPGRELILGIVQDSAFGPVVMVGIGGIYVEVMRDVTFRIPPISADDAREMLRGLRGYPILEGVRGERSIDLDRAIELIGRLSQLALDNPTIGELDINPVIAFPEANRFRVVDARISLSSPTARDERALDRATRILPRPYGGA